MRRAHRKSMPRKVVPSNRGTATRAEAAIELVRLEYERARLTAGIHTARMNLEGLEDGLRAVDGRIEQLNGILVPKRTAR